MKKCPICKRKHEGSYSVCDRCKQKNRDNVRRFCNENKAFIRTLKEKPCDDCGDSFEWFMMEWDHTDPSAKIRNISCAFRWSRKRILEEVTKCRLLCIGCHRLRTMSSIVIGTKLAKNRAARERNKAFVDELKKDSCTDCGRRFPSILMDLDHVSGVKVVPISNACHRKWSHEKILTEVAKCDLVCCWCHRRRTHRRLMDEVA
jgi:hypothetical protein